MKRALAILLTLALLCGVSGCRIKLPVPAAVPPTEIPTAALSRRFFTVPMPEDFFVTNELSPRLTGQNTVMYMQYAIGDGASTRHTLYMTDIVTGQTTALYTAEYSYEQNREYLQNAALSADGSILWLYEFHEGDVTSGGTVPDSATVKAVEVASGENLATLDLSPLSEDDAYSSHLIAAAGGLYLLREEDNSDTDGVPVSVQYLGLNGTVSERYVAEGFSSLPYAVTLRDGRLALVNEAERTLLPFAAGTVTPEAPLAPAADVTPEVYLDGGEDGQFCYLANDALYGEGTEPLLYLTAQGVNVAAADIADIRVQNGVRSILIQEDDGLGLYTLTPCTAEEAPQPLAIVGYQVDSGIHAAVAAYNRTHFDCTAMVEDYKQYNESSSSVQLTFSQPEGVTKLNTELLAGKKADVLILNGYISTAALTAQGALLDLYPLMDADREITRDTFVPSILEKTERDGHLYHLSTAFAIDTQVTNAAVIGDCPSLSIADWNALAAEHPDAIVSDLSEESFLVSLTRTAPYDFVSDDRTSCSFDSPTFVQYLKALEKQYSADELLSLFMSDQATFADLNTVLDGTYLTWSFYLRNFHWYQRILANMGDAVQFSGYLTENGVGHLLEFANTMGIVSTSQNVTGAWDFLKLAIRENTLGMEEGEIESPGFPCDRASFEAQLAYYRDPANFEDVTTYEGYPVAALSDADVARLYAIIAEAKPIVESDRTLFEILYTEVFYYLGGECTAEEAAARIQERAQLYLSEQK